MGGVGPDRRRQRDLHLLADHAPAVVDGVRRVTGQQLGGEVLPEPRRRAEPVPDAVVPGVGQRVHRAPEDDALPPGPRERLVDDPQRDDPVVGPHRDVEAGGVARPRHRPVEVDVVDEVGPRQRGRQPLGARSVHLDTADERGEHRSGRPMGHDRGRPRGRHRPGHGVHQPDLLARRQRPQQPVGRRLPHVVVRGQRVVEAAPHPEPRQPLLGHRAREPERLDVARGQQDVDRPPVDRRTQLRPATEREEEGLRIGPGPAVRGGDLLGAPREGDVASSAGLGERERDAGGERVGQVGQGERGRVVDDVLPGRGGVAGLEDELGRGPGITGWQHLQRALRVVRVEVVAADRLGQEVHARLGPRGPGRVAGVGERPVVEGARLAQRPGEHLLASRDRADVDAVVEAAVQLGLHLARLRWRQVAPRLGGVERGDASDGGRVVRRVLDRHLERVGVLGHSRAHDDDPQRLALGEGGERHDDGRWHGVPPEEGAQRRDRRRRRPAPPEG